jgi:DNA-binding winged helix-turn-helix (wHTH) protein/Tol biopolymer transport system component
MDSFKLSEFWVQPAHNKLESNGKVYKVEPKIMEVLCLLVMHQGQVVSRETIAQSLWSETIVGYDVITRAIFELRKILNDSAQHPKFIETIARKGYCFIYPLDPPLDIKIIKQTEEAQSPTIAASTEQNWNLKWLALVVIAIAIMASLTLNHFYLVESQNNWQKYNYRGTQLTNFNTYAEMPALNQTEDKMLFVSSTTFNAEFNTLVLMDLKTNKKTIISEEQVNHRFPKWGHKNQAFYFLKCTSEACQLIKHDILTGKQKSLLNQQTKVYSFDISPSEKQAVIAYKSGRKIALALVQLGQTEITPIVASNNNQRMPLFSPDGTTIFFVEKLANSSTNLNEYNIEKQTIELINSSFHSIMSIAISNEDLLISGKKHGQFSTWLMNLITGKQTQIIENIKGEFQGDITATPDKSKIAYKNWHRNIVIKNIGIETKPAMLNSNALDFNAIYSPEKLTFYSVSNRSGAFEIWQHQQAISQQITQLKANSLGRPLLSSDHEKLAFLDKSNNEKQLLVLDLASQQIDSSYIVPPNAHILHWSPAMDAIYLSVKEQGQYTLTKLNLAQNKLIKLVINAGVYVEESITGNEITYIDMSNGHLMRRNSLAETYSIANLRTLNAALLQGGIMHTKDWLYYIVYADQGPKIMRYNLSAGNKELFAQLPIGSIITQIGGKESPYVIYDVLHEDKSQIILLENVNKK